MASTINQAFRELSENLNLTGLQTATVSTRQSNVRAAIEAELTVLDSFLTGSYRRSTLISPLSDADIDIFMVLDSKYFDRSGQAALLDRVRRVLLKTYTKTPNISRNGQAVTIVFTDFRVDVVPAFNRSGGGFLIPDSAKGIWIETDPRVHVSQWAEANRVHNGDLVPLIKIIKCWNRAHSGLLRSFHLETMNLGIFNNVTISDMPSGARYAFDKMRALVSQVVLDPAGYGGDVGSYLDTSTKIADVKSRLEAAYTKALEAEALAGAGRVGAAFDKWSVVFGSEFPTYG